MELFRTKDNLLKTEKLLEEQREENLLLRNLSIKND